MNITEIEGLLKSFRWMTLQRMYGCAHSSIIGFISTEWINASPDNFILDGAPSPKIGRGRKGQKNADILLCKRDRPLIPVEVETNVAKYCEKLKSLFGYLEDNNYFAPFTKFGLLFMTNLCTGRMKYQHNWEEIKRRVLNGRNAIALVSIIKEKAQLENNSGLNVLRKRNQYYPWDIVGVDYWIYSPNETREGHLWNI